MLRGSKKLAETLQILLVEDNEAHAELIRRGLERSRISMRIEHVSDGETALDYIFQRGAYSDPDGSPRPHLVLLDLRLPRVDGVEVLRSIKADIALRKIPVVVLTSSEGALDVEQSYAEGANSYLVKPLDVGKFARLVEDSSHYWLAWNHHPWE